MLKSGITKRWILTTLLVITVILLGSALFLTISIRGYYYESVEKKLQAMGQSGAVAEYFNGYLDSSNEVFASRAIEYANNYSDINSAWVWVYNRNGEVVVTSTGFLPADADDDDYIAALQSPSGRGLNKGYLSSGEKFMALTVLLPRSGAENNGAVRYMISLQDIDRKVIDLGVIIFLAVLLALVFVVISGLFFVRSIVVPVKKINDAARTIAAGNYSERVDVANRFDEISELSESINYMTEQIARTETLKNDFISTVSHELRTPLTAIKGWTETLMQIDESGDETLSKGLRSIMNESERLYSLVEDLLDFSRLENGNIQLRLQKTDIIAELDEAVFVLKDRAMREGIEIEYLSPAFAAPANADPDRLKQVFVNIIDNAIKYTPAGGLITITTVLVGNKLKIVVSDTGCGIAEEHLPHVKERFYKANLSVKGSGIGLAVCDELITLHNGSLNIRSKLGEGTEAEIILPLLSSGGKES